MPDPVVSSSDAELRAHVERVLSSNYELSGELGRGGMGIVYRARDRRLKRPVAIKLLPPELAFRSEIRTRFLREAETAAQLSHPNIVPIYSVDERGGLVFFIMGYVEGDNLAKRVHDSGALEPAETRRILRDVADALAYAHERGVVHRDIKPDNILLDRETGRPMVTDFGIARALSDGDSRLTATGMAIGTPAYMSPEQSAGDREIDGRADLYSLGVVGYQMLCGELPFFASNTPAMLVKHISERPIPVEERRPGLPADLARAVMMLLEKDPVNRFPSARALVLALETGEVPERVRTTPPYDGSGGASGALQSARTAPSGVAGPTAEEISRWNESRVRVFRRKIAPYIAVNLVIVLFKIFGVANLLPFSALWSVYIAYQYARLWSDGFDWRDVFKQPRDRLFFDVAAESIDDARALFDKKKRAEVRARDRNRTRPSLFGADPPARLGSGAGAPAPAAAPSGGPHAITVQQAAADRDEIIRLVESLPAGERQQIPDVAASASALFDKIQSLAVSLSELERSATGDAAATIEREIAALEAQANPLDLAGSEERVRRLAYLKRQRRAVADVTRRRDQAVSRFESCRLALQNMRYDLLRLRTGGETYQHVTLVAEQAMALARDVDSAMYVADEMARLRRGARDEPRGTRA